MKPVKCFSAIWEYKHCKNIVYVRVTYKKQPKAGEQGFMLSFGPGFSAQRILLEW